jgi:hypothetical protein
MPEPLGAGISALVVIRLMLRREAEMDWEPHRCAGRASSSRSIAAWQASGSAQPRVPQPKNTGLVDHRLRGPLGLPQGSRAP